MHPELAKLLALQVQDLELADTDTRLKSVVDHTGQLDGALAGARREIDVARRRLEEGIKRREDLEVRIESYRAIQDRRRSRLESARGVREVQALMVEVEMARSVLAKEESEWVKTAEAVHDLERALKAAEARLAQLDEEQAAERARLETEREQLEAQRDGARTAREVSATTLDRTLRQRYDRLRSVRAGALVVVPLRGDACGACYTAVPRNRRTQIRSGDLLDACEACGVILYAPEEE